MDLRYRATAMMDDFCAALVVSVHTESAETGGKAIMTHQIRLGIL